MKVLITGATGFIGKKLVGELIRRGHNVSILTRDSEGASQKLPVNCEVYQWQPELYPPKFEVFKEVNAVIHLAGESIADGRWTESHKKSIKNSRVLSTRNLVSAMNSLKHTPEVFLSASAIGFYGGGRPTELYEDLPAGKDFLANVCQEWEQEVVNAKDMGIRTIVLRIGLVLGYDGGAMKKMLAPFWAGLGGKLGSGNQWVSWIHVKDLVSMMIYAIENPPMQGAYNAVSPNPVTNNVFTKSLGKALQRPTILPVPEFVLKIIFGEMVGLLLESQKVSSGKIYKSGFKFNFPDLANALKDICQNSSNEFMTEHWIPLPIDKIFSFFKEPKNIEKITPGYLHFKVLNQSPGEVREGTKINYWLRLHGIPIWWQSKITGWEPNCKFSDTQTHGPYSHWYHTHEFYEKDGGTVIRDSVKYRLPFGIPGDFLAGQWVKKDIENIFHFRKKKIEEIFKNQC